MKQSLLIFSFLIGNLLFAQDYLLTEKFDPDEYESSDSTSQNNHRFNEGWGLNTNIGEDYELINTWGSNQFSLSYKYHARLFKSLYWNIGLGYMWDNYKFKSRTDMMLHDSIPHSKVKLRVQSATFLSGFRFQSSEDVLTSLYFDVSGYLNIKTLTKYLTWDEVEDMKLKNTTRNLNYVNPFNYGVEARLGFSMISVYSRYRISDLFDKKSGYRELPRLSIGLTFEITDY